VTDTYYDHAGRTVAVKSPGGGAHVTKYDGAGRVSESQTCTSLGSTIYSSGAFDYSNDNKIVDLVQNSFDTDGRVTEVNRYEIEAGTGTTMNPSSPGSTVLRTLVRHYYDTAGRQTQVTDLGSFATGGLAGPMNGSVSSPSAYGTPESRSDTQLVTTWTFASTARLQSGADSDNKETRYEYDDLGQRTAMIEDYGRRRCAGGPSHAIRVRPCRRKPLGDGDPLPRQQWPGLQQRRRQGGVHVLR